MPTAKRSSQSVPLGFTCDETEMYVPFSTADVVPDEYHVGSTPPAGVPTDTVGPVYWFDTENNVVKKREVTIGATGSGNAVSESWIPTDEVPKYVVDDEANVHGKIVPRPDAPKKSSGPQVSFEDALNILRKL